LKILTALAKTRRLVTAEGETTMALAVIAKIKAKAGNEAQAEAAFREMITKVRTEPGTLSYILHKSTQDPTVFVFYETYQDQAAFDFHGKTDHMKALGAKLGALLDGRPEVVVMNEIDRK